jgi:hypothetical protein
MRKILFIISVLIASHSQAQINTNEKGVTLDLGIGATLHTIYNNVYTGNGSNAFANLSHINLKYKNGPLSYGLKFERLDFVTKNDSSDIFKNAIGNLLQYTTTFNIIEKKKFCFYVNTGIGVSSLKYERLDTAGVLGKIKMKGFSASLALGVNYHFKGKFGIFAQTGFIYNVEHLSDFRVNGSFIEEFENRPLNEVIFTMRGLDFKTGIRFAF